MFNMNIYNLVVIIMSLLLGIVGIILAFKFRTSDGTSICLLCQIAGLLSMLIGMVGIIFAFLLTLGVLG